MTIPDTVSSTLAESHLYAAPELGQQPEKGLQCCMQAD